jgi:hypothetical protein
MAIATDTYAEFSRNFATLEIKYDELTQRYAAECHRSGALVKDNERAAQAATKQGAEVRRLTAAVAEAQQYRERLSNASVAMEHLKGRLESARKAMTDRDMEHEHEVEQLRAQVKDLLCRVETNADAPLLHAVRQQKSEIEERCALVAGQLLEERERGNHQQLSAVTTLRDLNARNIELEQRCRSLDAEVTTLRTAGRRAADLANEAALDRERATLKASTAAMKLATAQQDVIAARTQLDEQAAAHDTALLSRTGEWDRERDAAQQQLEHANAALRDAVAKRACEAERVTALQRAAQSMADGVRDDMMGDVDAAQRGRGAALDEAQRHRVKVQQLAAELDAAKGAAARNETKRIAGEQLQHTLQSRLEGSVQAEAWMTSERDRLQLVVEKATQRCSELAVAAQGADGTHMELERLRMQCAYLQKDLADAKTRAGQEAAATQRLEELYDARLAAARRDHKATRQDCRKQLAKEERQKRTLLCALLEKEQAASMVVGVQAAPHGAAVQGGLDALALLKAQSDAAQQFQERLTELQDPAAFSWGEH